VSLANCYNVIIKIMVKGVRFTKIKYWALGIVTGVFLLVVAWWQFAQEAEANIIEFYPQTCLGAWAGVDHASGKPEVIGGGEVYTLDNSAVYRDDGSQIFCGRFVGELPPQTNHTKVTLRFSWSQPSIQSELTQEGDSSLTDDIKDLFADYVDEVASTTDFIGSTTVPTDASVEPEINVDTTTPTEDIVEESIVEEIVTPEESVTDDNVPSEEIQPELTTEPLSILRTPSLFDKFISTAHAQDLESSDTAVGEDLAEETKGLLLQEDAVFAVEFTLDGNTWHHVAYISRVTNDLRFELPAEYLETASDISNLQVAVRPMSRFDSVPEVYLDAMWLDVAYQYVVELGVHSEIDLPLMMRPLAEVLLGSTTATTTLSSEVLSIDDFKTNLISLQGINESKILAQFGVSGTSSLWIIDLETSSIGRLTDTASAPNEMKPLIKENIIFWFNERRDVIYSYDFRTGGTARRFALVANLPVAPYYDFSFPFTETRLRFDGSDFNIIDIKGNIVSRDNETSTVDEFIRQYMEGIIINDDVTPEEIEELLAEILEVVEEEEELVDPWVFDTDPHYFPEPDSRTTRYVERSGNIAENLDFSCQVTPEHVVLSEGESATLAVTYLVPAWSSYRLEVGSFPTGIDTRFAQGEPYSSLVNESGTLSLNIVREPGAVIGDFTIPITITEVENQVVRGICQLNVQSL
jgi:hypothetical protein